MDFVAGRSDLGELRHRGTYPDSTVPPSVASKQPVAWVVVFAPIERGGEVIDGRELHVAVDLESGAVAVQEW
jgi:hypothetical protein